MFFPNRRFLHPRPTDYDVDVRDFGAVADGGDITAAVQACMAYVNSLSAAADAHGITVRFPRVRGATCSETIEVVRPLSLVGAGGGGDWAATRIAFPDGVTAVRVKEFVSGEGRGYYTSLAHIYFNSTGAYSPSGSAPPGGYTWYDPLWTDVDAEHPADGVEGQGLDLRSTGVHVVDCSFNGFRYDGVHVPSTSNAVNCNRNYFESVRCVDNGRHGFFFQGENANINAIVSCDCQTNRDTGFCDISFLGNSYFGCHGATNGVRDYYAGTFDGSGSQSRTVFVGCYSETFLGHTNVCQSPAAVFGGVGDWGTSGGMLFGVFHDAAIVQRGGLTFSSRAYDMDRYTHPGGGLDTISLNDYPTGIEADCTAGNTLLIIPTPTTDIAHRVWPIKRVDGSANTLTVRCLTSVRIDNVFDLVLGAWDAADIRCSTAQWYVQHGYGIP